MPQDFASGINKTRSTRPQHQRTKGIGETRASDGKTSLFQFDRLCVIGREKYLKRCAIADLRIKIAGGPESQLRAMTGILLECLRNQ